jgi:hypothetical protein
MKLADIFSKFSPVDIVLLIVFIVYLVFPVSTPLWLVPYIDSPMGLVAIFFAALALFLYTSPILAVVFLFVAYELLRRNHYNAPHSQIPSGTQYMANRIPASTPTQDQKNQELRDMNPAQQKSLEEEVVAQKAPIVGAGSSIVVSQSFLPVADKSSLGASLV